MGHPRRRQPQCERRRLVSESRRDRVEAGPAAAAPARRADLPDRRRVQRRLRRTCSPAAFWTWSPTPRYEARFAMSDPDGFVGHGREDRDEDRDGANAPGAEARMPADGLPRLSAELQGHEDRAGVRRADVRLQLLLRRRRHGDRRPAARQTWRHHPGPRRRCTHITPISIRATDNVNATTPFEGTYYLTASGTPDKPIAIKAAGDGDVIFDGNGNFNLFNVKAAELQLLRRRDVPEHGYRASGRARSSSPDRKG